MRSGRIRVRGENRGRCRNKRNGPIIKMSNLCPDCPGHRAAKWAIKDIQDDNCLVKTLYHQPDYSGSSAGRSLTPWLFFKVMKEYAMFNKAGRKKYWWSVFLFHVLSLSLSHSCQRGWLEEPGSSQCVQQPDRRAAHSDQQPAEAQTPQPWVGHRVYFLKIFVFCVLCVCATVALQLCHSFILIPSSQSLRCQTGERKGETVHLNTCLFAGLSLPLRTWLYLCVQLNCCCQGRDPVIFSSPFVTQITSPL